ncbi:MAG: ClcB-like voltage-gated chloride channel protein [Thiohalocapsa sp.]|uniref:ClcB-like voltage-gated chloride channel protein n=1 Tax=Thiohalocapsa sp. TaxID=2497641 RepID=UPI0025D66B74|nr:ClcB-like voltage-gated chloride channel protein [Thiohalocapsa sp.]MCG6940878.1 ClcB-like voltage-gated chloride channel protein [Thiohalocapsa sp.]
MRRAASRSRRIRTGLAGVSGLWLALFAMWVSAAPEYGPVRPGETLWQIAGRLYAGTDLSRDQIMLALLQANPQAFSPSCNLYGILHVGAKLSLPSSEQVAAVDAASARRRVERQAQDWAEHRRSGRPVVCAAAPEVSPTAPAQPPSAETAAKTTSRPSPSPPTAEAGAAPQASAQQPAQQPAQPPNQPPSQPPAQPSGQPSGATAPAAPSTPQPRAAQPAESATQPPSQAAGMAPATSPGPPPLLNLGERGGAPLSPGPRAPTWAVAALLLVLIAATLLRWERHAPPPDPRRPTGGILQATAKIPARASLLLAPGRLGVSQLLLLSAVAGFLGALVTVMFREGIRGMEWLFSGQSTGVVFEAESLAPWQRLVLPAAGGLVAGLILQQIGGWLRGRSVTDYMEAIAVGDGWISVRHSLVKSGSSLVTVGSGGSIGREGAMVQLAAMVASALGRVSNFPRDRLRLLVAAGAAAGLAAAYNAPIAATLFIAEIVLGSIALEYIGPLIIAAVISSATVHEVFGYAPAYRIPPFSLVSDWELALYLVLGVIAGHVAPFFMGMLERGRELFGRLPRILALRLGLGGLVVGVISVYEPQVWGNGYSVVNSVLHDPWAWQALLTVLVLKMFATAATHGSGAVGGAFTPTIFVGAMVGALFGTAAHTLLPAGTASPSAYALVGMGAMLAGATHAPLMSILMVFELTLDYQIVLPLMLAVIAAHYTARGYAGVRPMYADSLMPREAPA